MRYRVEFADGSVQTVQKSSAKRYIRREDFRQIGNVLRQIRVAVQSLTFHGMPGDLPPAEIEGTKFVLQGRTPDKFVYSETLQEFTARQCWADWAEAVK